MVSVANDGTPIPAEMRERIFEPFTRLDEARSLDAGGSGLGLAIARSALVAVGGTIVADGPPRRCRVPGHVPGPAPTPGLVTAAPGGAMLISA